MHPWTHILTDKKVHHDANDVPLSAAYVLQIDPTHRGRIYPGAIEDDTSIFTLMAASLDDAMKDGFTVQDVLDQMHYNSVGGEACTATINIASMAFVDTEVMREAWGQVTHDLDRTIAYANYPTIEQAREAFKNNKFNPHLYNLARRIRQTILNDQGIITRSTLRAAMPYIKELSAYLSPPPKTGIKPTETGEETRDGILSPIYDKDDGRPLWPPNDLLDFNWGNAPKPTKTPIDPDTVAHYVGRFSYPSRYYLDGRCFERVVVDDLPAKPKVTVLIDCSGSMHINENQLRSVITKIDGDIWGYSGKTIQRIGANSRVLEIPNWYGYNISDANALDFVIREYPEHKIVYVGDMAVGGWNGRNMNSETNFSAGHRNGVRNLLETHNVNYIPTLASLPKLITKLQQDAQYA